MRGQRRDLSMMIPFSMEVSSLGRPAIPHCWILTSSPKKFRILIDPVKMMLYSNNLILHSASNRYRQRLMNAPQYAIIPDEQTASPGIKSPRLLSTSMSRLHLSFSSLRPSVSFYALSNLVSHSRIFLVKSSYCFFLSSNNFYNSLILELIFSRASFFTPNSSVLTATIFYILASYSLTGLVSVKTLK